MERQINVAWFDLAQPVMPVEQTQWFVTGWHSHDGLLSPAACWGWHVSVKWSPRVT